MKSYRLSRAAVRVEKGVSKQYNNKHDGGLRPLLNYCFGVAITYSRAGF